jgi:hypothetical protein
MHLGHLTNLDANEQIFFARELEHIKAKTYDILREVLKIRSIVPVSNEAGSYAQTITYRQYDQTGVAKIISNYADDLPVANIKAREYSSPVRSLGIAFIYSLMDIRASQATGKRLDYREQMAAVRGMAVTTERIGAEGDSDAGLGGFLNNANVTLISADDPGAGTRWIADSKTAAQILYDLSYAANYIIDLTKEVEEPDTQLLPTLEYGHISTKPMSDSDSNPSNTILKFHLSTSPWIKTVGSWNRLKTADDAGTGPRMVTYKRSPEKVTLELPQEFEMLAVQQENLSYKTPCHMRHGGVIFYYPLSCLYMDDI